MEPMASSDPRADLSVLESIQRRVLWLAALSVHHANTRPNPDGTKVGGHQPSSSSAVSLMTALYFGALREGDLVPSHSHPSPVPSALAYLPPPLPPPHLPTLLRLPAPPA